MRAIRWLGAAVVGACVLAGCGGDDAADDPGAAPTTEVPAESPEEPADEPAGETVLATAESDLGTIVVDGQGMTVYMFDRDTQGSGESTCSGDCLAAWPAVVADSESPMVEGVGGEVGTITRDDGTLQVTLNGWPLYYFAQDSVPGDTLGQAVNDVWWVLSPDGEKVGAAPAAFTY